MIELADDRHVKLVIETYYGMNQQTCNDTGAPGMSSANLTFRWQFLD